METKQLQRLLRILQLFSIRKVVTVNDLYKLFDGRISKRTLQRDLITLSDAGIPITCEKGERNENLWYLIDNHYKDFVPIPSNLNEITTLYLLKKALPLLNTTRLNGSFKQLCRKIEKLIPETILDQLEKSDSFYYLPDDGAQEWSETNHFLLELIHALQNRIETFIEYRNPGESNPAQYKIRPQKLLYYKGVFRIIALDVKQKDFRFFTVNRIQKLKLLDSTFEIDHQFDWDSFSSARFGLIPNRQDSTVYKIVLQFDPKAAEFVENRLWHPSQEIKYLANGYLHLSFDSEITEELLGWILSWREHVRVKEPKQLKQYILKKIEDLKLYLKS